MPNISSQFGTDVKDLSTNDGSQDTLIPGNILVNMRVVARNYVVPEDCQMVFGQANSNKVNGRDYSSGDYLITTSNKKWMFSGFFENENTYQNYLEIQKPDNSSEYGLINMPNSDLEVGGQLRIRDELNLLGNNGIVLTGDTDVFSIHLAPSSEDPSRQSLVISHSENDTQPIQHILDPEGTTAGFEHIVIIGTTSSDAMGNGPSHQADGVTATENADGSGRWVPGQPYYFPSLHATLLQIGDDKIEVGGDLQVNGVLTVNQGTLSSFGDIVDFRKRVTYREGFIARGLSKFNGGSISVEPSCPLHVKAEATFDSNVRILQNSVKLLETATNMINVNQNLAVGGDTLLKGAFTLRSTDSDLFTITPDTSTTTCKTEFVAEGNLTVPSTSTSRLLGATVLVATLGNNIHNLDRSFTPLYLDTKPANADAAGRVVLRNSSAQSSFELVMSSGGSSITDEQTLQSVANSTNDVTVIHKIDTNAQNEKEYSIYNSTTAAPVIYSKRLVSGQNTMRIASANNTIHSLDNNVIQIINSENVASSLIKQDTNSTLVYDKATVDLLSDNRVSIVAGTEGASLPQTQISVTADAITTTGGNSVFKNKTVFENQIKFLPASGVYATPEQIQSLDTYSLYVDGNGLVRIKMP